MFDIAVILYEVGPSRPKFWILDPAILEFEAKVCINGEEKSVQPPGKDVSLRRPRESSD